MIAYEFYSVDRSGDPHLLAILPERRKDQGRITEKSIRKWGRMFSGANGNFELMYFIRVKVPENLEKY